jgi:hypothetical protein
LLRAPPVCAPPDHLRRGDEAAFAAERAALCCALYRHRMRYLLLLVLAALPAAAQDATLRGFVRDAADGSVLQGVNVRLEPEAGGAPVGAATDRDGYFIVTRVEPGAYTLRVSYIGYAELRERVVFEPGDYVTREFEIALEAGELDDVLVEAEGEGAASMGAAGLTTVRGADLERIPTPGLSADLVGYLQSMPGVVSTGDRGGQLFVRGGTPSQNLVLIDGIPIFQPFHVIGFYSAFPAEILQSTDIYAGGFGARYGGRISSVIDVKTRQGNNRSFEGAVSAGPFLTAANVEGPLVRGRASFLVSARESVIEPVAPELLGRELPYHFWDRFAKVDARLGPSTSASVTLMRTYDRGNLSDLAAEDPNTVAGTTDDIVKWENEAYGARLVHLPEGLPIIGAVTLSYTTLSNEFGNADDPERRSSVRSINADVGLTYVLGDQEIEFGGGVRNVLIDYDLGTTFSGRDATDKEFLTEGSVFVDAGVALSDWFVVQPGIRGSAFRGKLAAEPRVRAFVRPGGQDAVQQLTLAWGLYRQDLEGIADRRDAGDVFTAWVATDLGDEVPRAMHAIAGYQVRPSRHLEFEVEGYYKWLDNLLIPEWSAVPEFSTELQQAEGRAWGVDTRVEAQGGPFFGYVSYAYSQVEYTSFQETLQLWYGTDELAFSPPHDRRHQINIVGEAEAAGFDLSVRWQFGSGLPFSRSAGFDSFVLLDSLVNIGGEPGTPRVIYGEPYDSRLPTYHRLDVSAARSFPLAPRTRATLQAGLINAYDRRNLFFLDLFTLRRINQLPLIPSFGLKLAFE